MKTLKRKTSSPTYDEQIFNAKKKVSNSFAPRFLYRMIGQVIHEKFFNYEKNEHKLPPSLRRNYQADKYYNAPTLMEFQKVSKEAIPYTVE